MPRGKLLLARGLGYHGFVILWHFAACGCGSVTDTVKGWVFLRVSTMTVIVGLLQPTVEQTDRSSHQYKFYKGLDRSSLHIFIT